MAEITVKLTILNGEIVDVEEKGGENKREAATKEKLGLDSELLKHLKTPATKIEIAQYNPTCIVWTTPSKSVLICTG